MKASRMWWAAAGAAVVIGFAASPTLGNATAASRVPLGATANVGGGWRLKITRASPALWVVDGRVFPLPMGGVEFLLQVAATWSGTGTGNVRNLLPRMWLYDTAAGTFTSGAPERDLGPVAVGCALNNTPTKWKDITSVNRGKVPPGGTISGRACFHIASANERDFEFRVLSAACKVPLDTCRRYVTFALR